MANVIERVRIALKKEAQRQTIKKGFSSGEFKISEDDWNDLKKSLRSGQSEENTNQYWVSLPTHINVCIQPSSAVEIGALSGTLSGTFAGGVVGGGSGAVIGAVAGTVVPGIGNLIGAGVGGLIGAVVGTVAGATGGGIGGASIGKGVKKYKHKFYISAKEIFANLAPCSNHDEESSNDSMVYASVYI